MDSDDNDAKEQNLHLAGEGISKVSPILHPYALPKFEFDDNLQGHLRFDTLVENEVFLGITSQEDNQWIEEYSRGTSAIQFNSSAAELRRKNVWSEATSSESVEMLLKSVGHEERVVEETTIEETVACERPGDLTNVMDPNLKQCDETDDNVNTYNAPVLDEFQESFVGSKASSDCEQSHAASAPQSQETPISGGKLDSVVIGDKYSLSVGEKKVDKICDDVNQEPINLANESHVNDLQEDPYVSKIECENEGSSSHSIEECQENPQEVPERCVKNVSGPSTNFDINEPEHINKSKENIMDNPTDSGTIVETSTYSMENLSVVSNVGSSENPLFESIPVDDKPTCSSPIETCDMQKTEGCNADVCSAEHSLGRKSEISSSLISSKIDQELNDNIHAGSLAISPKSNENIKRQAIEDDHTQSDVPDSPKSNVGCLSSLSPVQNLSFQEAENVVSDGQRVTFGASMVSLGNNQLELSEGSDDYNVGETSIAEGSSAEMPAEDISNKDEAAENHAPEVHKWDSNDGYQSSPAKIYSLVQVGDEIQSSEADAISMDQDVTLNERGDARLPLEFRDTDMDVVGDLDSQKNVESSPSAEGCEGVIAMDQGSGPNTAVLTDAVTAVEPSKISSDDTPDDVQLPSEIDATADILTEDQPISPILGVSVMHDDNEEKAVGCSTEESSQKGTQEVDIMVDFSMHGQLPVVEKDAVSDGAEKVVHELDDRCDPSVGDCNASPSEETAEDNSVDLKCSKTLETIPLSCESSAEGGNDAEAGGRLLDPKESITGDRVEPLNLAVNVPDEQQASVDVPGPSERDANHVEHNGVGSTSLDKPQIFSSSDTTSNELPQTASDKHEVPKDTMYVNSPLSKVSNDREGHQSVSSSSATKEEKSFTFEVTASAAPGQIDIQNLSLSKNTKISSVSSCGTPLDPNKLHEDSLVIQQTRSSAAIEAGSNGNPERKRRRKSAGKETAKKGNNVKETTPRRRSGQVEKSPAIGHVTSVEKLKPNESVECSNPKPGDISPIPTSILPDLNNSTIIFQQSFTDTQQVQLRAQILVYGSLISGMPPEESHMVAAFGLSDGGRKAWEAAWHACVERVHGRKSQANNPDTPMQSRSDVGAKDTDQGTKVGSTQNKLLSPHTPRPSNMGISSNIVAPMIPISSPLWNISTPGDSLQSSAMPRNALLDYRPTISPLHPYQTPRVPNFAGHNPSWPSQSPFPAQWIASSPVTAYGARLSALPITDAVKLTTVKESGAPGVSVIPVNHTAGPTVSSGLSSLSNMKKTTVTVSSGQPSTDSKSRKRKKVAASSVVSEMSVPSQAAHLPRAPHTEGYNQISFLAQNQTISGTVPVVGSHSFTSVGLLTPVSVASKSNPGSSLSALSPASRSSDQNIEKIVTREEIVSKIEESKLQAADAAVHAAAAVSHCQGVWSQLEKQKSSGLVSDDEAKLASSAASIAAAASVAKVAAAAAKIASNVAEQARLMADEVFLSSRTESYDQSSIPNFDKATPASILKSANRSDPPTSIISAAREAARRRIEAASAASKHAENLDAIVKAAELAAEAVSQAGKIVAMGNPLPVRELVEAGPEGYWKTIQSSNQPGSSGKQNVEAAVSDKDIQTSKHELSLQEGSRDLVKNQMVIDGISGSTKSNEKDRGTARPHEGSDLSKTVGVLSEPEFGSIHTSDVDQNMPQSTSGTREEDGIKEGCLVEVYKDDNKNKGAWFAANVLTLEDRKAFVCYTEIQSDEGSGKLKEWVPLGVEGIEAPKIRIAHPMTKTQFEGTRKRSRKAFSDHAWCSGDKVDVWVQDRWREAVVLETNKIDVTSLNVQFPGEGKTSIVRSWHVRPTLIWKDGRWTEWSSSKGFCSSEGDTPQEKRLRVDKPVVEIKEKDKSSISIVLSESEKHQQSRILPLSGHGSSFNVGKSSKDENKLENTRRTMRTGLQKERSRVVFGVPKPGKKQKFMDVSKHYVAEGSNKNNPPNDSAKLPSSSIPQPPGLIGSRNNPKNDAKEKQVAEVKSKVLKTRKPPIPSIRTLAQKDKSKSSKPTSREGVMSGKTVKDSVGVDENVSPPKTMEDPDATKGTLTSKVISQRLNKGKAAAGVSKAAKAEEKEKSASESEPRRSNRRIQPTSRLLEGLQSSLSVSKTPTSSHASQRSHNKVVSKGNG